MSYATEDNVDQILANLPIASGSSVQAFLDTAEAEMNSYMIGLYEVPVHVPDSVVSTTSGVTSNLLKSIHQDLSAGRILLSLDATMEDEKIHSYAEWLIDNSVRKLEDIREQVLILPGATEDTDRSGDQVRFGIVSSSSPDNSSYFGINQREVANPNYKIDDGLEI